MPELNHKLHAGRMNKDLDERMVPNGEYRHALNVEVTTSEGSNMGTLQTLMGNVNISDINSGNLYDPDLYCVGSIANEKQDKIYWLVSGQGRDFIAEYDDKNNIVTPVVVDIFPIGAPVGDPSRFLNFDKSFLITGINIIDDILFWTDNNTEPKRVHIERCKMGSSNFSTGTILFIRDVTTATPTVNKYISSGKFLTEEHITVIKQPPPTAPTLEMKNTTRGDKSGNNIGGEITTTITTPGNPFLNPATGNYSGYTTAIVDAGWSGGVYNDLPQFDTEVDYTEGDYLTITTVDGVDTSEIVVRVDGYFPGLSFFMINIPPMFIITVISGNVDLINSDGIFHVELQQNDPLFEYKFPRFAYRYKYEDGEYSTFSPFTEVAFLPGDFDYLPKEGYNLGMVNNIRHLAIKDFVHGRLLPDDVVSIDILYKESNSPNIYSVKTIKRALPDPSGVKYDEWNADSENSTIPSSSFVKTKGFVQITSEMIHAVLPSNQLLRPWDNVPRKALAQEVIGNRLVYANYLQNYNLFNSDSITASALEFDLNGGVLDKEDNITVDLKVSLKVNRVGDKSPQQFDPHNAHKDTSPSERFGPAKSIKTLRTYQLGVIYIDEYGRETPVFSNSIRNENSIQVEKKYANKSTQLSVQPKNIVPEWAKSYKFFIKETSSEYYNLAMDRWYDAEDGNIWLTFPSSERNKVDLETFLILKKEHDSDAFVRQDARYKIIAIENEAPLFVKTEYKQLGLVADEDTSSPADGLGDYIGAPGGLHYPEPGSKTIYIAKSAFEQAGWATSDPTAGNTDPGLEGSFWRKNYSEFRIRCKSDEGYSTWYEVEDVSFQAGGYIIKTRKEFGQDMSITSNGTGASYFAQRLLSTEVHLGIKNIVDRPEFDGRFFVKIKKDATLIDKIIKPSPTGGDDYYVTSAVHAQYIHYNGTTGSNIPAPNGGPWSWYDTWPNYIGLSSPNNPAEDNSMSVDERSGVTNWMYSTGGSGKGAAYWKKASYGDPDPNSLTRSSSSGWFIDKIEGFRNWPTIDKYFHKGAPSGHSNYLGTQHMHSIDGPGDPAHTLSALNNIQEWKKVIDPGSTGGDRILYPEEYWTNSSNATYGHNYGEFGPKNMPLVEGICTQGSGCYTDWYLGRQGALGPKMAVLRDYIVAGGKTSNIGIALEEFNSNTAPPHNMVPQSGIIPSVGIHGNIIHLSYSGIGDDDGETVIDINSPATITENQTNGGWVGSPNGFKNYFGAVTIWADKHVSDIDFINEITTIGSIWRWKEDPGQCVYETLQYNESIDSHTIPNAWLYVGGSSATGPGAKNWGFFDPSADYVYTNDIYDRNRVDQGVGDVELGIALYNYALFGDYLGAKCCSQLPDNYNVAEQAWNSTGLLPAGSSIWAMVSAVPFDHTSTVPDPTAYNGVRSTATDIDTSCGGWDMKEQATNTGEETLYHMQLADFSGQWGGPRFVGKWPMYIRDFAKPWNRRRRFQIYTKSLEIDTATGERYNLGEAPASYDGTTQHFYLPTNDPNLAPHFASDYSVLTPSGSANLNDADGNAYPDLPSTPAPGIRLDGMHSGYTHPTDGGNLGPGQWKVSGGNGGTTYASATTQTHIPNYKRVDGSNRITPPPGSVTFQVLSKFRSDIDDEGKKYSSLNPAIWETEPKENADLDIYHEVGQVYPTELNAETIEQFVGPVGLILQENPKVTCWTPPTGPTRGITTNSGTDGEDDIRVSSVLDNNVYLQDVDGNLINTVAGPHPLVGDILFFTRSDGSVTQSKVTSVNQLTAPSPTQIVSFSLAEDLHNYEVTLPWHNCYSFGNGVESDRIRDDYNQVIIDNGPKASTTLEEPYLEERRGSGLIYSGIYNSMSGINNLNQFIQAEKITKDLNPIYGTIQKLHTRNTNLLTLCEDKVFKILANKDALYNADGNVNLIATENVLGQSVPLLGEYGISTNPESFASESYRNYFTDKSRGAVIRLSQDGMTPISDVNMKDYFGDTLPTVPRIIGSFDNKKDEYNITLDYTSYKKLYVKILGASRTGLAPFTPMAALIVDDSIVDDINTSSTLIGPGIPTNTVVTGKTFISGNEWRIDLNQAPSASDVAVLGSYTPYVGGTVTWQTYVTSTPVTEYENVTLSFSEFAKGWTSFKSWLQEDGVSLNNEYYTFKIGEIWKHHANPTRNNFYHEQYDSGVEVLFNEAPDVVKGFQTLNYEGSQSRITGNISNEPYFDNELKEGWYVSRMYTDLQEGDIQEFKDKENKWFSQVKGQATEWLDDGTAGNLDSKEFSFQGIDENEGISIIDGGFTSWECNTVTLSSGPSQALERLCVQTSAVAPHPPMGTGGFRSNYNWAYSWGTDGTSSSPYAQYWLDDIDTTYENYGTVINTAQNNPWYLAIGGGQHFTDSSYQACSGYCGSGPGNNFTAKLSCGLQNISHFYGSTGCDSASLVPGNVTGMNGPHFWEWAWNLDGGLNQNAITSDYYFIGWASQTGRWVAGCDPCEDIQRRIDVCWADEDDASKGRFVMARPMFTPEAVRLNAFTVSGGTYNVMTPSELSSIDSDGRWASYNFFIGGFKSPRGCIQWHMDHTSLPVISPTTLASPQGLFHGMTYEQFFEAYNWGVDNGHIVEPTKIITSGGSMPHAPEVHSGSMSGGGDNKPHNRGVFQGGAVQNYGIFCTCTHDPFGTYTSTHTCNERNDPDGDYTDKASCEADANSPCGPNIIDETYNCDRTKGPGNCVDPGDGSGTFTGPTALADCAAACVPCTSPLIQVNTTPATQSAGSHICNSDGKVSIGVSGSAPTWTWEIYEWNLSTTPPSLGPVVYTDPTTYLNGNTSNVYGLLSDGEYAVVVTGSYGCSTSLPFTIICNSNPTGCAIGPYNSMAGASSSPHQTSYQEIGASLPGCTNGGLTADVSILGAGATEFTIEWFQEDASGGWVSLGVDPTTYTSAPVTTASTILLFGGLPDGHYKYAITDNQTSTGCTYEFEAIITCNTSVTCMQPNGLNGPHIFNVITTDATNAACTNGTIQFNMTGFYGQGYTTPYNPYGATTWEMNIYDAYGGALRTPTPLGPYVGNTMSAVWTAPYTGNTNTFQPANGWYEIEIIDDKGCKYRYRMYDVGCNPVQGPVYWQCNAATGTCVTTSVSAPWTYSSQADCYANTQCTSPQMMCQNSAIPDPDFQDIGVTYSLLGDTTSDSSWPVATTQTATHDSIDMIGASTTQWRKFQCDNNSQGVYAQAPYANTNGLVLTGPSNNTWQYTTTGVYLQLTNLIAGQMYNVEITFGNIQEQGHSSIEIGGMSHFIDTGPGIHYYGFGANFGTGQTSGSSPKFSLSGPSYSGPAAPYSMTTVGPFEYQANPFYPGQDREILQISLVAGNGSSSFPIEMWEIKGICIIPVGATPGENINTPSMNNSY